MAAFGTAELPLHLGGHCESSAASIHQSTFQRRITREAGQAMRILAHAIEHLSEESVQEDNLASAHRGEIKAVKLLMALNSQIYAECPAIPPIRNRVGAFLQRLGM